MQLLAFVLIYPILWLISILPFSLLYTLSDFVCFLIYRVFKYRKRTVRKNLALTLTHLSDAERKEIEKKFYSHLCDLFLEMIKTMSITDSQIRKRFVFTNIELIKEFEDKNKSVILMCAHYASWEWLVVISKYINFKSFGVYKKVNNKYFDRLANKMRERLNAELVETKQTINLMNENEANGIKAFYGFASDQSPQLAHAKYWDNFMGINVPVYTGAEMISKKLDFNILLVKVDKVKRGFYEASLCPLVDDPKSIPDYEISSIFLREVEKQILEKPEFYFWTHNRWKHAGKNPNLQTNS